SFLMFSHAHILHEESKLRLLDLTFVGIHMELLGVHNAQVGVGVLDVVQVLHSGFQSTHHDLSVVGHLSVSTNGGVGGEVSESSEVSLSPGAHHQKPNGLGSNLSHINLSPQAGDGLALSICPLNHGDGFRLGFILQRRVSDQKL
uniref:Uncharacterized protein n=1 Tax=Kryptolebias marmoratus TaxID=37003 RepID=A0A3Q3B4Q0_KRYMA